MDANPRADGGESGLVWIWASSPLWRASCSSRFALHRTQRVHHLRERAQRHPGLHNTRDACASNGRHRMIHQLLAKFLRETFHKPAEVLAVFISADEEGCAFSRAVE